MIYPIRSISIKSRGTVTELIADYFSTVLLPMSDYLLDIHSGGKTLEFLPFAAYHELDNKDQQIRCEVGSDGIIIGRHYPSLVKIGDCMNVITSIITSIRKN